jgi:hemerythrin-like metal-binding protein
MDLIEWDSSLELGIPQIDEHHQHLVDILNRSYRAVMLNDPRSELLVIMDELIDYATYHFSFEEQFMTRYGYEGVDGHALIHNEFSAKLVDFHRRAKLGETLLKMDVCLFLKEWLINHIMETDREYVAHMQGLGVI